MGTGPDSNPGTTQFWGASKSKRKSDTVLWYTYCFEGQKEFICSSRSCNSSSGKNTQLMQEKNLLFSVFFFLPFFVCYFSLHIGDVQFVGFWFLSSFFFSGFFFVHIAFLFFFLFYQQNSDNSPPWRQLVIALVLSQKRMVAIYFQSSHAILWYTLHIHIGGSFDKPTFLDSLLPLLHMLLRPQLQRTGTTLIIFPPSTLHTQTCNPFLCAFHIVKRVSKNVFLVLLSSDIGVD